MIVHSHTGVSVGRQAVRSLRPAVLPVRGPAHVCHAAMKEPVTVVFTTENVTVQAQPGEYILDVSVS